MIVLPIDPELYEIFTYKECQYKILCFVREVKREINDVWPSGSGMKNLNYKTIVYCQNLDKNELDMFDMIFLNNNNKLKFKDKKCHQNHEK